MTSIDGKFSQTPQLTSTPRFCRTAKLSLQDAFIAVSPILPTGTKERSKSMIPVPTGNRQSVLGENLNLFARRKTEFDRHGASTKSKAPLESKLPTEQSNILQVNALKKAASNPYLEGDNPKKVKIVPYDGSVNKVSFGPVLPSIPEHCGDMAAVTESKPSCPNIFKDTKVMNTAQSQWQVPKEIKKRFSLKHNTNTHIINKPDLLKPEQNLMKNYEEKTEDEMSPLDLCHSSKKRKIAVSKNENQNNSQNKKISIENASKTSLSSENNPQICDVKLQDEQNNEIKLNTKSENVEVKYNKNRPKRLRKTEGDNITGKSSAESAKKLNDNDRKSQLSTAIKSKCTVRKKIQETIIAELNKETNKIESGSNNQLPQTRGSKRKNNITKGEKNELNGDNVNNLESNQKQSLRSHHNVKPQEFQEKIIPETNKECKLVSPILKKKPAPRKNSKVKKVELTREQTKMADSKNSSNTKGKKTRKVYTEIIESDTKHEDEIEEVPLQQNNYMKEQEIDNCNIADANKSCLAGFCTFSDKSNNLSKELSEGSSKKQVIKKRRETPVKTDQCVQKNEEDKDDNVMKVVDGFNSRQIDNKTHIILKDKDGKELVITDEDKNNGNNNFVVNSKCSYGNVSTAQERKLKDLRQVAQSYDSNEHLGINKDVSDKNCTTDVTKSSVVSSGVVKRKISSVDTVEPLKTAKFRKRKLESIRENNKELVVSQELTQQMDNKTCVISYEGKKECTNFNQENKIFSDNVENKALQEVLLQTTKKNRKVISKTNKSKNDNNEKDENKAPQEVVLQTTKKGLKEISNTESYKNEKDAKIGQNRIKKILKVNEENCIKADVIDISNKENSAVDERKARGKLKFNEVEESSDSQEGVFQEKKLKRKTSKDENRAIVSGPILKEQNEAGIHLADDDLQENEVLRISDVKKCFGLKKDKLSMKDGVLMHTLVHVNNFVMTGSFTVQPGDSLKKSSTNTAYFVTSGTATVRIGPVTRTIRCKDVNCSFFIPKCSDFSIINEEEVPLTLYFTKFTS